MQLFTYIQFQVIAKSLKKKNNNNYSVSNIFLKQLGDPTRFTELQNTLPMADNIGKNPFKLKI